jgi:radical SAM/Cys-rich protein
VSNPTGAFLPAPERALENDFRARLGVEFTRLAVLTNMPIARYLEWLDRTNNTERYMSKLASAFNAATLESVMCRSLVSVGWDGRVWDCDFNQMLELAPLTTSVTIHHWTRAEWAARRVATASHCFGCTAGQGSSCGGALVG